MSSRTRSKSKKRHKRSKTNKKRRHSNNDINSNGTESREREHTYRKNKQLVEFKARQRKRDMMFFGFVLLFAVTAIGGYFVYDEYIQVDENSDNDIDIQPQDNQDNQDNGNNNPSNENNNDEPEINWLTYNTGMDKAEKQNLPVIIDFYADWCGPCKSMDAELYTDSRVISRSKSFVMIKVNGDYNRELMDQYNVESYPTIVFLDKDGNEVDRWVGWGYNVESQIVQFLGYMDRTSAD